MLVGEAGGRSAAAFAAALIALACAFVMPAVASAESFEVNSTADETDVVPGNEFCITAAGKCTLRAAIEEVNISEGGGSISFDRENVFDGQITGTIHLGTALPPIIRPISIFGECVIDNFLRPCVGVEGPSLSAPALTIEGVEAEIDGLAITGAKTGIEASGSSRFKVLSDWFGVKLDGSPGGNGTGMLLGKGSENVRIGSEGVTNVFANSVEDGLDIHGVSNVRVMSGYFGVGPDGVTLAPNGGKDIEVVSLPGSVASGTRIGTQLLPEDAASAACDGGCNVIAGAGASGVDLQGDGGEESPAVSTAVIGNYVGLDASGAAAAPNTFAGVHVGAAPHTVVGGPRATEANRFAGGEAAVEAGPEAANLVIRGNSVGVSPVGSELAPPQTGFLVYSEGLLNSEGRPDPAMEATIAGNDLRMGGGVGINQRGLGGWISGNRISGAGIGVKTSGETEEHGNLIEGNLVEGSETNGILLESGFNEVFENEIVNSGGVGVRIFGAGQSPEFGVSGNLIGGNVEADENLIAGSGGAAIEIANPEIATNEIVRNRGFANNGLFIDLNLVPFAIGEKKGTNGGIQPPKFFAVTSTQARGGGAQKDARIRLFRKAGSEPGELESFLGEAIADEEGEWKVVYDAPVPGGTIVAVTQTSPVGGTSELALASTPAEPSPPACAPPDGCGAPPLPLTSPPPVPETKIFKGPKGKKLVGTTAAFKFKASIEGSRFQCRLDRGKFGKCHSPKVYTGLKPGKHRFEVRAIGSTGEIDPSPAKLKFTVVA